MDMFEHTDNDIPMKEVKKISKGREKKIMCSERRDLEAGRRKEEKKKGKMDVRECKDGFIPMQDLGDEIYQRKPG